MPLSPLGFSSIVLVCRSSIPASHPRWNRPHTVRPLPGRFAPPRQTIHPLPLVNPLPPSSSADTSWTSAYSRWLVSVSHPAPHVPVSPAPPFGTTAALVQTARPKPSNVVAGIN